MGVLVGLWPIRAVQADPKAPGSGGFVFYRKPAPDPEPATVVAAPEAVVEPEPTEVDTAEVREPVPAAAVEPAPERARGTRRSVKALERENARQRAQLAALEAALVQAQLEVQTLQAKLQAILTVPQPEDTSMTRVYRVREGDSLFSIAQRAEIYGDGRLWKRILEANRAQLANPEQLRPGQQLIIPR